MSQQQFEAKNFDVRESSDTQQTKLCRDYKKLVDRYPGELKPASRAAFEYDLQMLMTKGLYVDVAGRESVTVTAIALRADHTRAVDAYVEYVAKSGHLPSGRLPVLFFLETHRFVRSDSAGV